MDDYQSYCSVLKLYIYLYIYIDIVCYVYQYNELIIN